MYLKKIALGQENLPNNLVRNKYELAKLKKYGNGLLLTSSCNLLCKRAISPCLGGNRVNNKSHW